MARKRLNISELESITPEEIGKLNRAQVLHLLAETRRIIKPKIKRVAAQHETEHYSYAYDKYKEVFENFKPVRQLTRNQALAELFNLKAFHEAESSTITGIKKIERKQDLRIFGETYKGSGKPKNTLSYEERKMYWKVYDEFLNQYKTAEAVYGSNRIQQYLGSIIIKSTANEVNTDDLSALANALDYGLVIVPRERRNEESAGNVYSGKGDVK